MSRLSCLGNGDIWRRVEWMDEKVREPDPEDRMRSISWTAWIVVFV